MQYTPMRHQQLAYDFCMQHERAGLFLGMGLGKTVTTLTVLDTYLHDTFTVRKALVIAPKNVAQNVWAQECKKWDHLQSIRVNRILGDRKKRLAALRADADLYVTNVENVVWLLEQLGGKLPYEMVILDELSLFKSTAAKRWKALRKAITPVRYVLGLTGTPSPNSYMDLWPEIYLLDGGKRLGRTITDYRSRYFTMGAHSGHIVYEWRLRIGARDTINRLLKDLCLSMSSEDWLTLPPVIYNTIPVEMDEKARSTYDQLKKEKVLALLRGEHDEILDPSKPEELEKMTNAIAGDTAAVLTGKLLQMANGAVYDDEGGVLCFHDGKLDALEEIVQTHSGESLLVFYAYQHDRDRILKRFPKARVFSCEQDVADWNAGKVSMLLCHPKSAGHGLNLQGGGHVTVWFGLTWSLELYQQANARLTRPGQTESVIIHHIVCEDTVDEQVMRALQTKNEGQTALLTALKQYLMEEIK